MKHDNSTLAYQPSSNGENACLNGAKEKPKTVYIKLHPKPNAPRFGGKVRPTTTSTTMKFF